MTTQKTGSTDIKKVLGQQFPQTKTSQPGNYDEEVLAVELSQEEMDNAILAAKEFKLRELKKKEYFAKVYAPVEIPQFTAVQMFDFVLTKAEKAIDGFRLNGHEKRIYNILAKYFTNDPTFEDVESGYSLKKGIYLHGNIGCGKTTAMQLFTDNQKQSYAVIACRRISGEFQKEGISAIEKYYGLLNPGVRMSFGHKELGICFDDLGTEGLAKNFGNESNVMSEILFSRYDNRLPSHITTNLSADQIEEFYGARIRSRMREMFNLIEFPIDLKDKRK